MAYYTLLTRSHSTGLKHEWSPQFGDYDKQIVKDELNEMKRYNKDNGFIVEFKIIQTKTCRQTEIDREIERFDRAGTQAPC